ncbi:RNA polymerase sigma factor [Limnoglobus roseus]|uniref:RNA polymerase sigma factor n=1 Tax=Limnoglobus roseus TaxID=2598579 RepID=A0A5C1AAU1_9BACT|nr:sigma-70 family RNA polymerase sigma factor [Limnoglobus roseus]QEL15337.1 RNA polymerase sigma factor [Limnoglobus roseus]
MTTTALPPTLVPPPDDPVRAALQEPTTLEDLRRQAGAMAKNRKVSRLEIDDLVSETVERALRTAAKYDPTKGSVGGWLYGVLVNIVREQSRQAGRQGVQQPADPKLWEQAAHAKPAADPDLAENRFLVERYLSKLGQPEQAVVKMRYLEEREYADIADRMRLSQVYARVLVSRGINTMKAFAVGKGDRP